MASAPALPDGHDAKAELKASLPQATLAALQYDESQYTNGSLSDDTFYNVSRDTASATPGTPLKVEKDTDTSLYTIPPATALSRFIFQSENLSGSLIPVSAFVLWPYSPRTQPDGYPIVAWAHGTSGGSSDCAPSHIRNLWQHFLGPYQLALQGYVVVAPDYSGLGVAKDALGKPIVHEYMASPSQANDVIYSVAAAQAAFPELSNQFVVIGHSQGGGAAWAVAQRQAVNPVPGYLGAVAISPVTRVIDLPDPFGSVLGTAMLPGIASAFPEFNPRDVLTSEGAERLNLVLATGGCSATSLSLLLGANLLKPEWRDNESIQKFQSLTANGHTRIEGPLLVLHGEADPILSIQMTIDAVNQISELFPLSQLNFISLSNVSHVPAMTSSQRLWMEWIGDRFAGRPAEPQCKRSTLAPAKSGMSYQPELNWFVGLATEFYQTP